MLQAELKVLKLIVLQHKREGGKIKEEKQQKEQRSEDLSELKNE